MAQGVCIGKVSRSDSGDIGRNSQGASTDASDVGATPYHKMHDSAIGERDFIIIDKVESGSSSIEGLNNSNDRNGNSVSAIASNNAAYSSLNQEMIQLNSSQTTLHDNAIGERANADNITTESGSSIGGLSDSNE